MLRWRDFFCPDDAGAAELVRSLGARLLGSGGEPPASTGEVVDIAAHRDPARPGHICSPEPLVHPRLRPRIAAALGLTPAQVAAVARYDTCILDGEFVGPDRLPTVDYDVIADNGGGAALRRLLIDRTGSDDLLLDHVPVLPRASARPRSRTPANPSLARSIAPTSGSSPPSPSTAATSNCASPA
ncbi:hypothetical protein [Nannocystis pusilla]|uniref:hypothetical protein n=1 Tax=Nannocystis pusilla TaxID=889268 RepID=UPI003B7F9CE1